METTIIVIISSIVTVVTLFLLTPIVVKKAQNNNIPIDMILSSSDQVIKIAQNLIGALNIAPQTRDVLTSIMQSATIAVRYAEQLYLSGKLEKDERKNEAIRFVKQALTDAGIEINEDREILISSVIESAVFLLPKTN